MTVKDNTIAGTEDFLTGFLPANVNNGPDNSLGRPVDVIFDKDGSLYVSDDKAGAVYKVIK
ncbi:MAG: hypothetical protein AAB874_07105 [Patescibacteria group bacterium]